MAQTKNFREFEDELDKNMRRQDNTCLPMEGKYPERRLRENHDNWKSLEAVMVQRVNVHDFGPKLYIKIRKQNNTCLLQVLYTVGDSAAGLVWGMPRSRQLPR